MKVRKKSTIKGSVEGYASCLCMAAAACSCSVNTCVCNCYNISDLKTNDSTAVRIKNAPYLKTNLISTLSTSGKAV